MMMRILVRYNLAILLILATNYISNLHVINSQTQDSCTSNINNLNGQISFDTSSLNCFPVWPSQGFILRYSQAGPSLWSFLLSAPNTNSYIGIGFSPNGGMVGSTAVVGWAPAGGPPAMRRYLLGGQTPSEVIVDRGDVQILGNTSTIISDSSRIYLAFQLITEEPSRQLVFAVGDDNSPVPALPTFQLTQHLDQIAVSLNYASGQSNRINAPYSNLKRAHGVLNMIGWGILIPIGAIIARYSKHLDPLWFYLHTSIQCLGFILGLSGVIAGFVLNDRLNANVKKHKALGIIILALGCLQVIAFLARPNKDAKVRKYWNWYHYSVGRLMIIFAIANIFYGIHLAKAGSSWNAGYGVVLGIFVTIVLILELRMLRKN